MIEMLEGKVNNIGRLGENLQPAKFFVGDLIKTYPGCTFNLLNKRPNDPDAYPVPSENYSVSGNYLYWIIGSGDLAQQGDGECEIVASLDEVVKKTAIYKTHIDQALDGAGTPPDPWKGWIDEVTEAAETAEAILGEIQHLSAEAETLAPDAPATASYDSETGVLTIGVPKGDKGDQGEQGERGFPGLESQLIAEQISGNKYRLGIERV